MAKGTSRRPLRTLILLGLLAAAVVAVKNALADRGGSYDPPAPAPAATPSPAPAETPAPAAPAEPSPRVVANPDPAAAEFDPTPSDDDA